VNQTLNKQLQAQQALLNTQNETLRDTQQVMLDFKKTTEEMANDRGELLKIIEGMKTNQLTQEAEMTCLKVYQLISNETPLNTFSRCRRSGS
jgi:nitrate reductase NapAB chaperone NapD